MPDISSSKPFFLSPRHCTRRLWYIVARPCHCSWIQWPKHAVCFEPGAAVGLPTPGAFLPSGPCNLVLPQEAQTGSCPEEPGKFLKTSVTKHVSLYFECSRQRPADSPSFSDVQIVQDTNSTILTLLLVENTVDTLIDTLNTHIC